MALSSWFVSRGYVVVLPLRRGYGETGGTWAEAYGSCQNPDYYNAGLQSAADIKAALDYMRGQPYVAPDRSLVVGQSAGGWATLALSSQNPAGVSGMIDFAGGRGGHQKMPDGNLGNCTPNALVSAAGKYGSDGARADAVDLYRQRQLLRAQPRAPHVRRLQRAPAARAPIGRSAPSAATVTT